MTDSSPEIDLDSWKAESEAFIDRSTADGMVYVAKSDVKILALIAEIRKRDQWIAEKNAALRRVIENEGLISGFVVDALAIGAEKK